jgi:hypothetical protein
MAVLKRRKATRPKVFGIGFHKTGTTSLAVALGQLGYRVTGPNGVHDPHIADSYLAMCRKLANQFDAFQDNPWPLVYREMDRLHPGSKFILTLRESDEWLRSAVGYFGSKMTPMRELIYGYGAPVGHEERYVERFEQHNQDVLDYFKNRPHDLLVFRITEGEGWERLGRFLGAEVPSAAFPHAKPADGRSAAP